MFFSWSYGIYQTLDFHDISKVNTKSCFPPSSQCLKYCDEILSIQLCLILFVKCFLPLQETQKLCIGNQTNHCDFGCCQSWSGKQPTGLEKKKQNRSKSINYRPQTICFLFPESSTKMTDGSKTRSHILSELMCYWKVH